MMVPKQATTSRNWFRNVNTSGNIEASGGDVYVCAMASPLGVKPSAELIVGQ